jgi:hypothetical protein
MSGPPPCGRKESGDDGGRTRRGRGCHRRRGRGRAAVAESADQSEKQDITPEASKATDAATDAVPESLLELRRPKESTETSPRRSLFVRLYQEKLRHQKASYPSLANPAGG